MIDLAPSVSKAGLGLCLQYNQSFMLSQEANKTDVVKQLQRW